MQPLDLTAGHARSSTRPWVVAAILALAQPALAQPGEPAVASDSALPTLQIHGFASQGAFISTANDVLGHSSRGSLELFEAAVNVSSELGQRLRVGLQLYSGNVGTFSDGTPRVDWAYIDYRARPWLGVRAGVIKIAFGLYNEFTDIDAARVAVLLPQSVYPARNRDALLAHTGFSLYGSVPLARAGELDYQAFLGSLTIPRSALELSGAALDEVDTRYVAGGQVFWRPPLDGLRLGASVVRASIDFHLSLAPATVQALIEAGAVPADFDGRLVVAQRPASFWIGSAEYQRGDWSFAAEYHRERTRQTTRPELVPTFERDSERFYGLVNYRLARRLETGAYYSVTHADVGDRRGRALPAPTRSFAFQRDLAATLRFDVTEHWLWKLEAHLIDGAADLSQAANRAPTRLWGLFLLRTTVVF